MVMLAVMGLAAFSALSWLMFQAAIALWRLPGDLRRLREAWEAREAAKSPLTPPLTNDEKLRTWFADGRLTMGELELLAEYVEWQGRALPTTAEQATAMLWADFEAQLAPPLPSSAVDVATGAAAVPDLPLGYFDGRVSAERPEDVTGWVEWERPGRKSIWIRKGS